MQGAEFTFNMREYALIMLKMLEYAWTNLKK